MTNIVVQDNFTRANANPIGGIYSGFENGNFYAMQIASNVAQASTASALNVALDITNSYANNQFATCVVGAIAAGSQFIAIVRCTAYSSFAAVNYASFTISQGSTTAHLYLYIAGAQNLATNVTLNTTPATGDVYTLSVSGQGYTCFQNGAVVATYTDAGSNFTTGVPGFGINANATLTANTITFFQAGGLGTQSTIALLQQQQTSSNSSATTISQTLTVSQGSYLGVFVTNDTVASFDSTISDGTNTYTRQQDINDATNKQRLVLYTTPNVTAGVLTITATFGGACTGRGIAVAEIGGCVGLLTTMGQLQTSPGTASNGVSTGLSGALASLPNLIYSIVIAEADTTSSTAGTGFSSTGFIWNVISGAAGSQAEQQSYNSNTSVAATWTAGVNSARISMAGIWTQSTATSGGGSLTLMGLG